MPDNCFWTNEVGAYEICSSIDLPDLPVGWNQFSVAPDAIIGRGGYGADGYPPSTDHPATAKPVFGNGAIVIGCTYFYGVPFANFGSHETYGVYVSTDDGFTWTDLVEKFAWLPGAGVYEYGYDASYDFSGLVFSGGTRISFDGAVFYEVSNTMNDTSNENSNVRTSKSVDGITWSNIIDSGGGYNVIASDSLDGDIWFLGNNATLNLYSPFPSPAFCGAHSADDGATWTTVEFEPWNNEEPEDSFGDGCANADGFHCVMSIYEIAGFFGLVYHKPTSVNTWATRVEIFDNGPGDYYDLAGVSIIASRSNPNYIHIAMPGGNLTDDRIAYRRSTDGGDTFEADVSIWVANPVSPFFEYFVYLGVRNNPLDMVELDDGRIVVVFLYQSEGTDRLAYIQSYDNGENWTTATEIIEETWVFDDLYYSARLYATAKGNDVVLTQTHHDTGGRSLIFRP